jgi:MFS family permease
LGLRANVGQFVLLVGVQALVGGMLGQERTILPLIATHIFALKAAAAALTFIVAFGVVKAITNLVAGTLADRVGRKPLLVVGWLAGVPVPLLLIWAPSWGWVIVANVLLALNQGFAWTNLVNAMVDLAGPARRGLAVGLNEWAGYTGLALTALATGFIAQQAGLRPAPFFLGLAYVALGLSLSTILVRETRGHARHEGRERTATTGESGHALPLRHVFALVSLRERALSAVSLSGLVTNLKDGMAWGLLPLYYAAAGLPLGEIGVLAAAYPAVWGLGQLITGPLSDRLGRKRLIVAGMLGQGVAIGAIAASHGFAPWLTAATLLGLGTAMVYPTLIAAVGDVAHPAWRASALGVYRFWRDLGFAVGALLTGLIADRAGFAAAIWVVALLAGSATLVAALRMYETHPQRAPALVAAA